MILVMSGTKDGRELIQQLSGLGCDIIATTTTQYGGSLIEGNEGVDIIDHALDVVALAEVMTARNVRVLIDATHPYAINASENAMAASKEANCHYVRYERAELEHTSGQWFNTYDEIIAYLKDRSGNMLLTIGANNLELFAKHIAHDRIFARVLPMSKILAKCEGYGLNPKNLIAVQGPFSTQYNEAMIRAYDIKFLVTKATAKTGGFDQKIEAAKNMDIELLVLKRPAIDYSTVFTQMNDVVRHVENLLKEIDTR